MFAAVARFLANIAGPAGTLLVLDDLQWAGADALDLLMALVRAAPETPVRVVGAYRDTEVGPQDPLSAALGELARAEVVVHHPLAPLTLTEASALLDSLLGGPPEEGVAVREQVLRRAGGVPFFLISCARGLQQAGRDASDQPLPWDLHQSIRQRVTDLATGAQEALGVAAIAGREATRALLVRATGRAEREVVADLDATCRARLLEEAGPTAYRFAHDVIREVVEADLGAARRALLHRTVASAIEAVHAGRLPEQYEALADHYWQAEAWAEALAYLALAGDKAAAAYATQSALDCYTRALAACEQIGEATLPTVAALAQKRGALNNGRGNMPAAIGDFDRMLYAAQSLGDRHGEGMALVQRGMSQFWDHAFDAADRSLRDALAVAGEDWDDVRYAASVWLGGMYQATDRWPEGEPILRSVEELGSRLDDPFTNVWWSLFLGNRLGWEGRYGEALALYERARAAADRHAFTFVALRWMESVVRGGNGEYRQAFALLEQVLATCEHVGELIWQARALNQMGWLYSELQDHRRALEWNRRGVQAALDLPSHDAEIYCNAVINMADNLLALGLPDEAEQQLQRVERVVRHRRPEERLSHERFSQRFYHSYGEIWLTRGAYDRALTCAAECLALAEPGSHRKNIAKGRRLRGQALLAQGHLDESERELAHALAVARALGNPPQLWKTLVARGDLCAAQERRDEAELAFREAQMVIDSVAAGLSDTAMREALLESDHVRRIRQRAG
jgi:tetratricopeptide (TPR) repeat protein